MSQRLDCALELYHSPRVIIFVVSGLREWVVFRVVRFTRGCSPPNPFGGSVETRQNLFTPHHILEWGAKTCLRTRYRLYELPSGSRPPYIRAGTRSMFVVGAACRGVVTSPPTAVGTFPFRDGFWGWERRSISCEAKPFI